VSKKPVTYEVTLRRDVQQVTCVRVQASSPQEAIDVAESVSSDVDAWNVEEYIGTHKPEVKLQRITPIKGRATGKADRRTDTDRRADKRRLDDKSNALVAARTKRTKRSKA
jgi:hypothetical protein